MAVYASDPIARLSQRVKPVLKDMYGIAYAITGNDDEAEYVLQQVITKLYKNGVTTGFQDQFRSEIDSLSVSRARENAREQAIEINYRCFISVPDDQADPIIGRIQMENAESKRLLMLKYACGLNAGVISSVTGADAKSIRRDLDALTKQLSRYGRDQERTERRLARLCREELAHCGAAPDLNAMMRSIELETSNTEVKKRLYPGRIATYLIAALLTLFIAVMVWLTFVFIKYYRDEEAATAVPAAEVSERVTGGAYGEC